MTANIRAYGADMAYTEQCMVAYGPEHNTDMLIYAANMAGMVRDPQQKLHRQATIVHGHLAM